MKRRTDAVTKRTRKIPRDEKEFRGSASVLHAHAGATPDVKEAVAVGATTPAAVATMDSLCKAMGLELVDAAPNRRRYRKAANKLPGKKQVGRRGQVLRDMASASTGQRGSPPRHTNRIIGSNVRSGTEMPVEAGPLVPNKWQEVPDPDETEDEVADND